MDLTICGGADDFNLARLALVAEQNGKTVRRLFHASDCEPAFSWDLQTGAATLDGEGLSTRGLFLRYDVFTPVDPSVGGLDRALGWYNALLGWGLCTRGIRLFNRQLHANASLKPFGLLAARRAGLRIPESIVSNELQAIDQFPFPAIAKPVAGGSYTKTIDKALAMAQSDSGRTPMPAIVQRKLAYPEYRVFVIGRALHVFEMYSRFIDYRPAGENRMSYLGSEWPFPAAIEALLRLLDVLDCDYCACDFKTDPETGEPVFLELNSGPMFAAFDINSDGALCRSMADWLCKDSEQWVDSSS